MNITYSTTVCYLYIITFKLLLMFLSYLYIEHTEHKKVKNIHLRNNKSQVQVHYESNLNAFNRSDQEDNV